jgi:hypothetical protein
MSDLLRVIQALRFDGDYRETLRGIPAGAWGRLLRLTDEAQLTLPLALRCAEFLPEDVRTRVQSDLARNAERSQRTMAAYDRMAAALNARGIEFLILKGFTQWPHYCEDLRFRPQYDIDFFVAPGRVHEAAEAVGGLGYEPVRESRGPATDHLPTMLLRNGWRWRGDYFDPEMPPMVETHFRFWNEDRELFPVSGAEGFWERRVFREIEGRSVPALCEADAFAYATWHVLRHALHGNLRLYHVYELAHFLDHTAADDAFWSECRHADAAAMRLAWEWFKPELHAAARERMNALPRAASRWFDVFAFSPALALETPNKHELFLHLCLAQGWRNRARIVARRLLPTNPPRVEKDPHVTRVDLRMQLQRMAFRVGFLARRAVLHMRSLGPLALGGVQWWRAWRRA